MWPTKHKATAYSKVSL